MNLYELKELVWQSTAVRQCERCGWQCVAVRTVVCAQCARQCAAVFLVMYGSAHGSVSAVRQCSNVQQCAAVCGSAAVRQCAAVCGSVAVRV